MIGGRSKGGGIFGGAVVDEGSVGACRLGGLLAVEGLGFVRTLRAEGAGDAELLCEKATDPAKLNRREKLFVRLCGLCGVVDDLLDVVDCDQRFNGPNPSFTRELLFECPPDVDRPFCSGEFCRESRVTGVAEGLRDRTATVSGARTFGRGTLKEFLRCEERMTAVAVDVESFEADGRR
jgi:hypothetical protein